MSPARIEDRPQEEILLLLRGAIDTAINDPKPEHTNAAVALAVKYPRALTGGKLQANLGRRRWDWLNEHGVTTTFGVTAPDFTS